MTRLSHPLLVASLGFSKTLDDDPRWYPAESDVQRLFYHALRHTGIEGSDALQILHRSPTRFRQVLGLLNETDLISCRKAASLMQTLDTNMAECSDILRAWCTRETVFQTLKKHTTKSGQFAVDVNEEIL